MSRYPVGEPHTEGRLDVGDGHTLHWTVSGTLSGKPVVVLHGGPGSGSGPWWRRLLDPSRYCIVQFDQRNCGRSTPSAAEPVVDLSANTTQHLIADVERLRQHLGIDRWLVLGASWGSCLGLAYAEAHPDRVTEVVLFAVTAGTEREIQWLTRDMGRIFPREWEAFRDVVPPAERDGNLPQAYSRLLHDCDPAVREHAARQWCRWEDVHISLTPGHQAAAQDTDPAALLTFARLVTHYWGNGCFLAPGQILDGVGCLAGIPAVLVHGRLDVSSPLDTAWQLHRAWPGSELVVLEGSGHGGPGFDEPVADALDRFASLPPPAPHSGVRR